MSRRWGVIPAAGLGTRIQPLAFSKELLPVGTRHDGQTERPLAVCEYLLERMLTAGATRVCFVISPAKTDIMSYFGGQIGNASICYAVQQNPNGLCDALFSALPLLRQRTRCWSASQTRSGFRWKGSTCCRTACFPSCCFPLRSRNCLTP